MIGLPVPGETVLNEAGVMLIVSMVAHADVEKQTVVVITDAERRGMGIFHVTGAGSGALDDVIDVARGANKLVNPDGFLLSVVVLDGYALPMQEHPVTT